MESSEFFVGHGFSPAGLAAVAMLPSALSKSDLVSLGARWAFSVQPVLSFDPANNALTLSET